LVGAETARFPTSNVRSINRPSSIFARPRAQDAAGNSKHHAYAPVRASSTTGEMPPPPPPPPTNHVVPCPRHGSRLNTNDGDATVRPRCPERVLPPIRDATFSLPDPPHFAANRLGANLRARDELGRLNRNPSLRSPWPVKVRGQIGGFPGRQHAIGLRAPDLSPLKTPRCSTFRGPDRCSCQSSRRCKRTRAHH